MRVPQPRLASAVGLLAAAVCLTLAGGSLAGTDNGHGAPITRAALPPGAIDHILVINLENENFSATFGPKSPAVYLNSTLLAQGELLVNYFGTSHVSLGNYLSQVSGQAPTPR